MVDARPARQGRSKRALFRGSAAVLAVAFAIAACSSFSSDDAGPVVEAGGDAGGTDVVVTALTDASDVTDAATPRDCPSAGGAMVRMDRPAGAGSYCIDATEVTQAQYQAFLTTLPTKTGGCEKMTLTPNCKFSATDFDPAARAAFPVSCVDWCDAKSFCEAHGKRLCRAFADVPLDAGADRRSEWFGACSAFNTQPYPWGQESARDAGNCNIGTDAATPTGGIATCVRSGAGLFDLIGNVREWEDDCTDAGSCTIRGAGFPDTPNATDSNDALHCSHPFGAPKLTRDLSTGFRCCADLR